MFGGYERQGVRLGMYSTRGIEAGGSRGDYTIVDSHPFLHKRMALFALPDLGCMINLTRSA